MTSKLGKKYARNRPQAKEYLLEKIESYEKGELPKEGLIAHVNKFSVMLSELLDSKKQDD